MKPRADSFEKINKIDKHLASLIKNKEDPNKQNKKERKEITINIIDVQKS